MNTDTIITPEFEIVPADAGLDLVAKNTLEIAFSGFFTEAAKWKDQAAAITDPKLARTARLELKNLRVSAEKKRKELKEDSLRMGKAIDGANNILLALIVPIEKSLEDIEKAEERRAAEELRVKTETRTNELRPFIDPSMPFPNVGAMTDDQFAATLADAKLVADMKAEAARKAEAERIEREAAEARERLRIAEENARLKAEAEAREKALAEERAAAEKARQEAMAKVEAERKAAEEKARKEREEIEAKAAAEKAKLEAEAKAAREKAEAAERKEREAREKAEAEAKAKRDEEEKRAKEEAAAKAKAAKAPDKDKLKAFASVIRALKPAELTTPEGKVITGEIEAQVEKFAAWVEKKSEAL